MGTRRRGMAEVCPLTRWILSSIWFVFSSGRSRNVRHLLNRVFIVLSPWDTRQYNNNKRVSVYVKWSSTKSTYKTNSKRSRSILLHPFESLWEDHVALYASSRSTFGSMNVEHLRPCFLMFCFYFAMWVSVILLTCILVKAKSGK